jgi:hypothetical protein
LTTDQIVMLGIAFFGVIANVIIQSAFVGGRNQIITDLVKKGDAHDDHFTRVDDALTRHNSDIAVLQVKTSKY